MALAEAAKSSRLFEMNESRCWELLGASGVGRIVFDSEAGPVALPVNYRVANRAVMIRTSEDGPVATIAPHAAVSFEIDEIDQTMSTGWSVLVYATCEHVGAPPAAADGAQSAPTPWAGGKRDHWLRLRIDHLVGRKIESGR